MLQNAQVKNAKMTVLSVDNVWTAEFAANGIIRELPADQFPTDTFLKAPAASATYFDKLYAYPYQTDGGLLYYRSDLLKKYDLEAPTTWAQMKAACQTIQAGEKNESPRAMAVSSRSTRGSPATSPSRSTPPAG